MRLRWPVVSFDFRCQVSDKLLTRQNLNYGHDRGNVRLPMSLQLSLVEDRWVIV